MPIPVKFKEQSVGRHGRLKTYIQGACLPGSCVLRVANGRRSTGYTPSERDNRYQFETGLVLRIYHRPH